MIYILLFILLSVLTLLYDARGKKPNDNSLYFGIFILFVLLLGLRYRVGGDSIGYMDFYKTLPKLSQTSFYYLHELGRQRKYSFIWLVICSSLKQVSASFTLYQFVHAILINSVIFLFIIKNSKYVFGNLLMYYLAYFLYFNTEILRESIAIIVFILCFNSFSQKKWFRYYLGVFIAILFHLSAIILLILPLIYLTEKFTAKGNLLLIIIFSVVILIAREVILNLVLNSIEDESLRIKLIRYNLSLGSFRGILITVIFKVLFPFILLIINDKINNRDSKFRSLALAYILFSILAIIFSPFSRFSNYLTPVFYVFLINTTAIIYKSKFFYRIRQPIIVILLIIASLPNLYYYGRSTSERVPGTRFYHRWVPYKSVFTKEKVDKRETVVRTYNPKDPSYYKEK